MSKPDPWWLLRSFLIAITGRYWGYDKSRWYRIYMNAEGKP